MLSSDWSSDVCSSDLQAVNACIQLLGTLDGCQLITVEHLARKGAKQGRLHPVQQAMVDCHGSQCGFCTPGFVMSLFAMTRDPAEVPDEATVDEVDRKSTRLNSSH